MPPAVRYGFSSTSEYDSGDVIEVNLVELGRRRIEKGIAVSAATQVVLTDSHRVVLDAVDAAVAAVAENIEEAAASVTGMKKETTRISSSTAIHEAQRLVANEPHRIEAYTIEMDITEKLQRIYYFSKRMARTVKPVDQTAEGVVDQLSRCAFFPGSRHLR